MKPLNIENIAELAGRVKSGDEDAFIELYNQMYQKIYFFAVSIVKDEYLAQDVVQETFISVFKNIGSLENNRVFIAWINRIAYNCSLKIVNSNKAEIPVEAILAEKDAVTAKEGDPLDKILSKDESNKIMKCILDLPPEFKTTLILRYYAELKLDEIAIVMECSLGTVKSRLSRGKALLRKSLRADDRMLSLLLLGGLTLSLALRPSMQAYAGQYAMSPAAAKAALTAIQQRTGIKTAARFARDFDAARSGKKKPVIVLLGGAAILGVGIWGLQDAQVQVTGNSGQYTNRNISVEVEVASTVGPPIRSIRLTEEKTQAEIPLSRKDWQTYLAEIEHNGIYYVEVSLMNGKTVGQQFRVGRIDKEKPKLYWHSWDVNSGLFYGLVSDDLSGVDYERIYTEALGRSGKLSAYEEAAGRIEIHLPENTTNMMIYDKAGNRAVYEISPHVEEPE